MTRILRLLLIAAIALPMWQPAAAQDFSGDICQDANVFIKKKNVVNNSAQASGVNVMPKVVVPVVDYKTTTVCDGAQTYNLTAPMLGEYFDTQGCRTQMIYPSSYLTDIAVGDTIFALRFFTYYNSNSQYSTSYVPEGMGKATIRIG